MEGTSKEELLDRLRKAAKGSRDIVLYNVDERKYQRELDQWYKKQKKKR